MSNQPNPSEQQHREALETIIDDWFRPEYLGDWGSNWNDDRDQGVVEITAWATEQVIAELEAMISLNAFEHKCQEGKTYIVLFKDLDDRITKLRAQLTERKQG